MTKEEKLYHFIQNTIEKQGCPLTKLNFDFKTEDRDDALAWVWMLKSRNSLKTCFENGESWEKDDFDAFRNVVNSLIDNYYCQDVGLEKTKEIFDQINLKIIEHSIPMSEKDYYLYLNRMGIYKNSDNHYFDCQIAFWELFVNPYRSLKEDIKNGVAWKKKNLEDLWGYMDQLIQVMSNKKELTFPNSMLFENSLFFKE